MGRGRTRSIRFALAAALVVALAGITATVAHALAFDDATPCPVSITNGAPLLVCPSGAVGTPYNLQLAARGGCEPSFVYRVESGSLPAGLSLSSSGLVSGTPTQSGESLVYLQIHDVGPAEGGPSWCTVPKNAERQFRFNIDAGLQITTNDIPQTASVGQPYSATLDAQVVTNTNPLAGSPATGAAWSVVSGFGTGLPPGLALANGVISGTPTTEGSYSFRIQATLNSASHVQTYSLTVRQPLSVTAATPLATPPLPTAWEVGVPFSAKLTPAGGNGTYTFTLASGTLPTGLALGADGAIIGTPRTAGVSQATVRVTDGEGRTVDYPANFGVAARIAVSTIALRPGRVGKRYRAKLTSTGGLNPRVWKLAGGKLPRGLRFDRRLGIVSGVPKKAGSPRVTFQVTDGLRVVARKTLRIVIVR